MGNHRTPTTEDHCDRRHPTRLALASIGAGHPRGNALTGSDQAVGGAWWTSSSADANGVVEQPFHRSCQRLAGRVGSISRLDRITSDPAVCHGKPVVRGLRYPVEMLLELLAAGMSIEKILDDYADLETDDILAVLEYASIVTAQRTTIPFNAA
ncbi:DUF433 domain-containing protein [Nocardia sp. NPDC051463]|uniref:DUF433 domain-containing protein n=1 Tax=Nocardia sp. NPDC051463 TaxID=3154845 RepID=UPI00344B3DAA